MRPRFARTALAPLIAALLLLVPSIGAGVSTDPVLVLSGARAEVGVSARLVRIEGVFPAQDLVQQAFPLQILLRETTTGSGYVRYDLSGAAFIGSAPEIADGLDAAEAVALLGQGAPAPGAEVLLLARDRIEVLLPVSFPSGPAEAQLFVIDATAPILSNPVPFSVGGAGQ
ncbi:MAG: hypothetical protein ACE5FL_00040 [Myxococcota bacterium]